MSQQPKLTFGQQLAFAHRTLTRRLHLTLEKEGVAPATWYALITLNTRGAMTVDALREELAQAPAVASVDELSHQGLVSVSDEIANLTPEGWALFERLREIVQGQTQQLMQPLDPADIETTKRVLGELTARAEELIAAA
jgi:DNA-binding MarR family transcriptional regulator